MPFLRKRLTNGEDGNPLWRTGGVLRDGLLVRRTRQRYRLPDACSNVAIVR